MVGQGPAMDRLRAQLAAVAGRDCTVMVHGESGSGKELAARTIHALSARTAGPFIAVDCTGLRDTLLESQLFGHVKGAFTGADHASVGFIRAADRGTLFLDEIGELEPKTQAKLLRVLQERVVVPLGATKPVPIDVRVVCASHRDLRLMASRGEFREDLLFRLDVVKVSLPSLRERQEDIAPLATHFLRQLAELYGEPARGLTSAAAELLRSYSWPGNVRELANAVEHAVVFATGAMIDIADLPDRVRASLVQTAVLSPGLATPLNVALAPAPVVITPVRLEHAAGLARDVAVVANARAGGEAGLAPGAVDLRQLVSMLGPVLPTIDELERAMIARALELTGGNQNQAAAMLNLERRRLYRKVARYGLRGSANRRVDASGPLGADEEAA